MINNKVKNDRGFTLMETIVAIFILLLAITGPMAFSQNGLRAAFQSRDQITAFFLAQDAIEYVKNFRDTNILSGEYWLSGIESECTSPSEIHDGCSVDTYSGNFFECSDNPSGSEFGCLGNDPDGSEDVPLQIDENGYFGHDPNGDESTFSRSIYIDEVSEGVEAEIVVKVRWTSHDTIGVREITVVEYIYDWGSEILGNE